MLMLVIKFRFYFIFKLELKLQLNKLEENLETNKKYANKLESAIRDLIIKTKETTVENRIGVLVISCNRPHVTYHLDQLLK
jgi:hypothetical protein